MLTSSSAQIILFAFFLTNAEIAHTQPELPGPYQAGWTSTTIQRGTRSLSCRVYYPAFIEGSETQIDTLHGPYSVVGFGHGFFMQTGYYLSHFRHLATHGHVVIAPQFPDTQHGELADDLLFCLEYIRQQHANPGSRLFGLIDTSAVGLSGHSMGGGACLLAASREPRVKVVAPLAAAETNPSAIAAMPLIRGFVYLISGASDGITPPLQHQVPMYNNAHPVKGLPLIIGANHTRFMDVATFDWTDPGGTLTRPEQLLITRRYLTAVFNLVLKQNPAYWMLAFGDSIVADSRVTFSVQLRPLPPLPFSLIRPAGTLDSLPTWFTWHRATSLNPEEPVRYSLFVRYWSSTVYSETGLVDSSFYGAPVIYPAWPHLWYVVAQTSDSTTTTSNMLSVTLPACRRPPTSTPIEIRNAGTDKDTLWFGFDPYASCGVNPHLCEIDLVEPCGPPSNLFCVYWDDWCNPVQSALWRHDFREYRSATQVDTFHLFFQAGAAGFPITWRWDRAPLASLYDSVVVTDQFGGVIYRARMDLTDSLIIGNTAFSSLWIITFGARPQSVHIQPPETGVPAITQLHQNYPNPFNPSTAISYQLSAARFVSLKVYDVLAREVATLVNEEKPAGEHSVTWDATGCASGTYFARLLAGGNVQTRKMVLSR